MYFVNLKIIIYFGKFICEYILIISLLFNHHKQDKNFTIERDTGQSYLINFYKKTRREHIGLESYMIIL
jgi:hypothetical protein